MTYEVYPGTLLPAPVLATDDLVVARGPVPYTVSFSAFLGAGTTNQLAYYSAPGVALTPLNLGVGFSIISDTLNFSGGTFTPGGAANSIQYNQAGSLGGLSLTNGQVLIGATAGAPVPATLTQGSGITITSGAGTITIAATGSGSGTVNSGTTNTLAFYATNGTTVSPLTLGTNLSISGTTLNAASGGSSTPTRTTYTSAGAIASGSGDALAVINNASPAAYTVADGSVDLQALEITNIAAGAATITFAHLGSSGSTAVLVTQNNGFRVRWNASPISAWTKVA